MSRPEHLSIINTPEGIRRINEDQRVYDEAPEAWEQREREEAEQRQREEQEQYEEYQRQQGG